MLVREVIVDAVTGETTERMVDMPCMTEAEAKDAEREQQAEDARVERNRRLAASDWSMLPDAPVDRKAWQAYRQALRDVPEQAGFPDVEWPATPVR